MSLICKPHIQVCVRAEQSYVLTVALQTNTPNHNALETCIGRGDDKLPDA